eukprot:71480-Prorocentrum_minimum.AAC.1
MDIHRCLGSHLTGFPPQATNYRCAELGCYRRPLPSLAGLLGGLGDNLPGFRSTTRGGIVGHPLAAVVANVRTLGGVAPIGGRPVFGVRRGGVWPCRIKPTIQHGELFHDLQDGRVHKLVIVVTTIRGWLAGRRGEVPHWDVKVGGAGCFLRCGFRTR